MRVEYNFGSTTGVGHTDDISEGGLFLVTQKTADAKTRIYLRLYLPGDDEPLKIVGSVTRTIPGPTSGRHGMGVRFEVAYSRTREQLASLMDRLFTGESHGEERTIRQLEEDGDATTYEARFELADDERPATLRPRDVSRVFAFEAEAETDEDGGVGFLWKLTAALAVLIAIVYAVMKVGACS